MSALFIRFFAAAIFCCCILNAFSQPLSVSATTTNVTCNGSCDGTISVTAIGGQPPYTIIRAGFSSTIFATGVTIPVLCAGPYSLTIKDAAGDSVVINPVITEPLPISFGVSACPAPSCRQGILVTGGQPPYTFNWSNGATVSPLCQTNISPGSYTVTVTDVFGCTATQTVVVPPLTGPQITITPQQTNICSGDSVTLTATGVASGLYTWNTGDTTATITVSPGQSTTYFVVGIDSTGCGEASTTISVTQLNASINGGNAPICPGTSVNLTATGANPFTGGYLWNTGSTMPTISVAPMVTTTYSVTVTGSGCTDSASRTVVVGGLMGTISSTNATCNNSDGSAVVTVTGGAAPYQYIWSNGMTGATATNLSPGTYCVTAYSSSQCSMTDCVTIGTSGSGFTLSSQVTNATCGNSDGSATVNISGGTPSYFFSWQTIPQQFGPTATGLAAGSYTVFVSDVVNCRDSLIVTVSDAGAPTVSDSILNTSCHAASDGAVFLAVSGGTPPYQYLWSTGDTSSSLTGLGAGSYIVTITDSTNCQAVHQSQVLFNFIQLTTASTSANCSGQSGTATVTATGGTPPYTFAWSNGATGTSQSNLNVGGYSVTATDANGCTRHTNVLVKIDSVCLVTISGYVYVDQNNNCTFDSGEPVIPNFPVRAVWFHTATDSNGYYQFSLNPGSYTVSPQYNIPAFLQPQCLPHSYSVSLLTAGQTSANNNFAFDTTYVQDVKVEFFCGVARPGFLQPISFTIKNLSYQTVSGTIEFHYDSKVTVNSSANFNATPDSVDAVNHIIFWSYNLNINETKSFTFNVDVQPPPNVVAGTVISHNIIVNPVSGDFTPFNNIDTCYRTATNAFDPNDKAVSPSGDGASGNISPQDTVLKYTIRFQNTGNDTAFTVVIKDTLSTHFNYRFFETATASHPYVLSYDADNILVFTFNDIMLPDSFVNEPASKGHVSFYLQLKENLPFGTEIENSAAIYFDYNEPVITNTVLSTIFEPVGIFEKTGITAIVYPNPASSLVKIFFNKQVVNPEVQIMDISGKMQNYLSNFSGEKIEMNIESLKPGIYFYRISEGKNIFGRGKIVVMR